MKIERFTYLCMLVMISATSTVTYAQVTKEVEVTKAYIPEIEPSERLMHEPNMSDTVKLRPEIAYAVTSHNIESRLVKSAFKPIDVPYVENKQRENFYIKAGAGLPLQTEADLYFSHPVTESSYILSYLNHSGQYADIDDISAARSHNRFGLGYGNDLKNDKVVDLDVLYNFDSWSRYATPSHKSADPRYNKFALSAGYGDRFTDWSHWNWGVDLNANHFWNNTDVNSSAFDVEAKVGRNINTGKISASLGFEALRTNCDYTNNAVVAGINYCADFGSRLDAQFGVAYRHDKIDVGSESNTHGYFLPSLTIKHRKDDSVIAFFEIESNTYSNDYASLTEMNPYILSGEYIDATNVKYDARVGIEGVVANNKLSYRASADFSIEDNALYWALMTNSGSDNYYVVNAASRKAVSANLESEWQPARKFGFMFDMSLTKYYDSDKISWSRGLPAFEMGVGTEYNVGDVTFELTADIQGVSYTTLISETATSDVISHDIKKPLTVNVGLNVDWKLNDTLAVYVHGDNLANADLYRWMGYREYGIGVIGGVKIEF